MCVPMIVCLYLFVYVHVEPGGPSIFSTTIYHNFCSWGLSLNLKLTQGLSQTADESWDSPAGIAGRNINVGGGVELISSC